MDFLEKLFGDPADLVKRVITHTSASLVKPVFAEFFNHRMNAGEPHRVGQGPGSSRRGASGRSGGGGERPACRRHRTDQAVGATPRLEGTLIRARGRG